MRTAYLFISVCIGISSFCSCQEDKRLFRLTVSVEPLRYIVEYLAGDRFEATTLTPENENPETYTPTSQQMERLSEGVAYFRMGTLGFESTQLRKIAAYRPHQYIVNASERIPPLPHCNSCQDGGDPHTWMSPRNMKLISENICLALCKIDSAHTKEYRKRLDDFHVHVDSLDALLQQLTDTLTTRSFLINHPSLAYFSNDYGLHQLGIEYGGEDDAPVHMQQLEQKARNLQVRVVFVQKQHSDRAAVAMAEKMGLDTIIINPLAYDWDQEILKIARALR